MACDAVPTASAPTSLEICGRRATLETTLATAALQFGHRNRSCSAAFACRKFARISLSADQNVIVFLWHLANRYMRCTRTRRAHRRAKKKYFFSRLCSVVNAIVCKIVLAQILLSGRHIKWNASSFGEAAFLLTS